MTKPKYTCMYKKCMPCNEVYQSKLKAYYQEQYLKYCFECKEVIDFTEDSSFSWERHFYCDKCKYWNKFKIKEVKPKELENLIEEAKKEELSPELVEIIKELGKK